MSVEGIMICHSIAFFEFCRTCLIKKSIGTRLVLSAPNVGRHLLTSNSGPRPIGSIADHATMLSSQPDVTDAAMSLGQVSQIKIIFSYKQLLKSPKYR